MTVIVICRVIWGNLIPPARRMNNFAPPRGGTELKYVMNQKNSSRAEIYSIRTETGNLRTSRHKPALLITEIM